MRAFIFILFYKAQAKNFTQ